MSPKPSFGLIGALSAFPFRLAKREIERQGGACHRGSVRRADALVFGRDLLRKGDTTRIERALADRRQRPTLSEAGFLRRIGLRPACPPGTHDREEMLAQSGLEADTFDRLVLFDAFECHAPPFSFRDLILARKYRDLIRDGASWDAVARAVHQAPERGSVASLDLAVEARAVVARKGEWQGEIGGQGHLDLGPAEMDADAAFEAAEQAESDGDLEAAARLYGVCLSLDPGDAVAAFNRAACLQELGRADEAVHAYQQVVKLDPGYAEAWFNLAGMLSAAGKVETARRHLQKSLAADPEYADAAFNLAMLEYDAGNREGARRWWQRYLDLDSQSEWAERARAGLKLIALEVASGV